MARLQSGVDAPVFETIIKENDQIAGSAEFRPYSTLRQKYGYAGQFDAYKALTEEFLNATTVEAQGLPD